MSTSTKQGITRRDFAKATAMASVAILTAKSGMAQTNSETLRVGLLGCGSRGSGAAAQCLQGNENVKLIAISVFAAVVVWLVGRACRYVLAGT
ncbi:MAG: hypothetical protein WD873_06250 [Candidatus Hydrogenedentales bacterium]